MFTLNLDDGDLVIGPRGFDLVAGAQRITQDLRGAILEPLGNDRFHPGYGSRLDNYVGRINDPALAFAVRQEVTRIVSNYVSIQRDKVERDAVSAGRARYTTSDVIASVGAVHTTVKDDSISVVIEVNTSDRVAIIVMEEVGG